MTEDFTILRKHQSQLLMNCLLENNNQQHKESILTSFCNYIEQYMFDYCIVYSHNMHLYFFYLQLLREEIQTNKQLIQFLEAFEIDKWLKSTSDNIYSFHRNNQNAKELYYDFLNSKYKENDMKSDFHDFKLQQSNAINSSPKITQVSIHCKNCNSTDLTLKTVYSRGLDEPPIQHYSCKNCGKSWNHS